MLVEKTKDMVMVRGIGVGGTTTLATGNAVRCDGAVRALGIDLDEQFAELSRELPITTEHQQHWTETTWTMFRLFEQMGVDPVVTPKLMRAAKCVECGHCAIGCPTGAKWDTRALTKEAVQKGAVLVTDCRVTALDIENGQVKAVHARRHGKREIYQADLVVLAAGGLRKDLVEALRALHPKFLRFPGGCVVEGTYVRSNAYDWKQSVGDPAGRREIPNTWGGMQTMGVGFYEYFCLCEEIGALPVPVVHAGLLCQARDPKGLPLTMEETEQYARDILDLIDFAQGDEGTEWGRVRIQMGHPEPFDLRYLAIGNENWGAAYFGRYELLSKAVKEKHPDITCIVAAGPVAEGSLIQDSWNQIRRRFADDLVDEHYYMDSSWFPAHVNRYDRYPRTTKVFLGEFAAHEPVQGSRRPGNLYAALCEAAYLTGIERNSDLVEMCCYAPLLCREGEVDWTPDLIWFNDEQVYGTPSYYVQQMFSQACGTELVASETDGNLFHAATRTDSELQIKIVNLSDAALQLSLLLPGVPDQESSGQVLTGEKTHVNSFARPDKVAPKSVQTVCFGGQAETELPPWSLTVLNISLEK